MMLYNIVFDLDGTLADTQKIHQEIESGFLSERGVNISGNEIGQRFAGRSPLEWIPEFLAENGVNIGQEEMEAFINRKDSAVIAMLESGKIGLMPHVREILSRLHIDGHKIGISSGACRGFIDRFIAYFGFEAYITASTSADEVINKKPAPDVFLKTFEKLETIHGKNDNKIVVGDGLSDAEGGKRSGAFTIWIPPEDFDTEKSKGRISRYVDRTIHDFDEITQGLISSINIS